MLLPMMTRIASALANSDPLGARVQARIASQLAHSARKPANKLMSGAGRASGLTFHAGSINRCPGMGTGRVQLLTGLSVRVSGTRGYLPLICAGVVRAIPVTLCEQSPSGPLKLD
jgi:hypothetical protein